MMNILRKRALQVYQKIQPIGMGAGFIFLITIILYYLTLAPTYTWAHDGFDAGDLLTAIKYSGVPHPPGFPIYILIGKIFILLPLGNAAFRLNFMSAFFAAMTVAIVYITTYKLTKNHFSAIFAGFVLAVSRLFWEQSVITEVYILNVFFSALMLLLAIIAISKSEEEKPGNSAKLDLLILLSAFIFGLSLSNHLTAVIFGPGLLILTILITRQRQFFKSGMVLYIKMIGVFAVGLLPYLYIYITARGDPFFNWGNPSTPSSFIAHITGREFQHFIQLPNNILDSISNFIVLLNHNFTLPGIILGIIGLVTLSKENRKFTIYSLLAFIGLLVFNLSYKIENIDTYYLPIMLIYSIWIGYGVFKVSFLVIQLITGNKNLHSQLVIFDFKREDWRFISKESVKIILLHVYKLTLVTLLFLLPIYICAENYSKVSLKKDHSAQAFADGAFRAIDQSSAVERKKVLIPEEAEVTFALRYYRYFDYQARDDVILIISNGIYDSEDNLMFFREKYPELIFPDHPTGVSVKSNTEGLMKFIKANWEKYDFYYARGMPFPKWGLEQQIELEGGVMLSSVGPIYKVHPKGVFD